MADLCQEAAAVPCERLAVIAGGLPGGDKSAVLTAASVDRACYFAVSVGIVLEEMAVRGMIPPVAGLSPMEASDLVHAEVQFVAKRAALRAMADGRNLILDVSMASAQSVTSWLAALRSAAYAVTGVFADVPVEESVRRADAAHRRGEEDYRHGHGCGGRYIPAAAIRALAAASTASEIPGEPAAGAGHVWFHGGEVATMISTLRAGQLTQADLARQFRDRTWPRVPSACPPGMEEARPAIDDLEPYVPGSFDDVVLAYDLGQLTDGDYDLLAAAVA